MTKEPTRNRLTDMPLEEALKTPSVQIISSKEPNRECKCGYPDDHAEECPLYSKEPTINKCCEKCENVLKFGKARFGVGYCPCVCHEANLEPTSWENSFEKKFAFELHPTGEPTTLGEDIKQFITQLLVSERKALVERIVQYHRKQLQMFGDKLPFVVCGGEANEREKLSIYEHALQEVINLINE